MLLIIARIIGAFSSYGKPRWIAFALAVGLTLALIPGGTLFWFFIFIPMMLIRINQAALIASMAAWKMLMPLVDPLSERLGYFLLTRPFLYEPMGRLLSLPMLGWFRLNDSLVLGGLVLGAAGLPLWFIISLILLKLYRRFLEAKIKAVFRKLGEKVPLMKKMGLAVSAARNLGEIL